jgi:uncharacterized protein YebE (UPF0316 family)
MALLCLKVFIGRFIEVTLSTMNTLYIVKGKKLMATIIGFIDILIWFLIVKEALSDPKSSIWIALSYAGGYAVGTYFGSIFAGLLIKGTTQVNVVTKNEDNKVTETIKENGYGASIVPCYGLNSEEESIMIFAQVDNRKVNEFKKLIKKIDPHAFVTITESKENLNGYFGEK